MDAFGEWFIKKDSVVLSVFAAPGVGGGDCRVLSAQTQSLPLACFVLPLARFVLPLACFVLPLACFVPALCCPLPALCLLLLPLACSVLPLACSVVPLACFVPALCCPLPALCCPLPALCCRVIIHFPATRSLLHPASELSRLDGMGQSSSSSSSLT